MKAIVGCDMDTAQDIFDAFWEAAKPLAMYKKALTDEWKMNQNMYGQKFITGIDGRKIPTRSEHALVNSSFQSAGVICAKLAMVLHDDYLKEEGLSVDFFVDNWKEKSYCQQMIAYHDESQLEVTRDQVVFKRFETKEQAQEFKDQELETTGKIWSDISHHPRGGVFVAYSRPGELAVKAVVAAGEAFNLNVPLSAGYILGNTWGSCH